MDGNFIIIPGIYAVFVNDWLKVFPREQFHFIRFENYKRNKTQEVDRVLKFLDTGKSVRYNCFDLDKRK